MKLKAKEFNSQKPPEDDYPRCIRARRGNYKYNVADWGHLGYFGGKPGSMKTTTIRYLIAAGLSGEEKLNFEFDLGDRAIIVADGEQPEDLFESGMHDILRIAGKQHDNRLIAASYTEMTNPLERYNDLLHLINRHRRDVGMVVMDGLANFMYNPNDRFETMNILREFDLLAKKLKFIPLMVNHLTDKNDKTTKLFGVAGTEVDKLASWGFINEQQSKYYGLKKGKFRFKQFPNLWFTRTGNDLIPEPYFPC